MKLLQVGHAESLKLAVHRGMKWGAGLCFLYNFTAWCVRREAHLGTSAVIYALLWKVEDEHVKQHARARAADL